MSPGVDSWYHEKESAWLYRQVAAHEPSESRRDLFLKLASAADEQALRWEAHFDPAHPRRTFTPSSRARVVAALLPHFGPRHLRPVLAAMKLRGMSVYAGPAISGGHIMPTSVSQIGERHRSVAGGNLRALVFGMNDGLVSNAALVIGVAGAGASSGYVVVTGVAGLLAGALSMAAGEYVSVRTQREMYEYQIALEREEVAEYPDEEAEELALIYAARGVQIDQAREVAAALFTDPEAALDVLAREELGLNPDDLGSPVGAATTSFTAFALGAAVPLAPFLLGATGARGTVAVAIATLGALALVGLAMSLFTGRAALRGAVRMMLIGAGAGIIAFLVGRLLGVTLA